MRHTLDIFYVLGGQETPSHWQDAPDDTPLTSPAHPPPPPGEHKAPGSINIGSRRRALALMSRWDHSTIRFSVVFLRLTRLSTSQRYEPIKGVFHTATTRTRVLINPGCLTCNHKEDRGKIVTFGDFFCPLLFAFGH